ncbi:energy-coupling factor ABC transporter ATP-binding protein [Heyndrickxia camelliae]|uniref:Cobalt ABC transporter ATP-binding protein n=1 Tax=Heyndrickxia camelliae TaxID=1707093 RepID=A0A2N3LNQ5_9BACI|nr:ABC transporter ATP-binding protein [Heyndrickxia camelliae]PKR86322.1 cobalt ABC transporter ATP-binding protein [Heyndrickxia camelliae]
MNLIRVQDLSFSYGDNQMILQGLNLEFTEQTTAIIGQNGAGKTTFVKLLKGLLTPSSGDIFINNINTKELTAAKLAKYIGLVFQNPNDQIFKSKVIDEVMFGPLNIGYSEKESKEYAIEALELVGLSGEVDRNPYDLSLSQRKMITVASVLAMQTNIIIFDEPTMGQDYEGKEKLKEIMRRLHHNGKLVISILHDMDFVAEVFERTIVFNRGRVLMDGDTRSVFSKVEMLKGAYLDQPFVTQVGKQLGFADTFLNVDELVEYAVSREIHN